MTDKPNERETPLTNALIATCKIRTIDDCAESLIKMTDHARALERHAEALAEALDYALTMGCCGDYADVYKAKANYEAFKREKGTR